MMKNLNESRRKDEHIQQIDANAKPSFRPDTEVVPFLSPGSVAALLPKLQVEELHSRWTGIQGDFVDHPRKSVEDADELVATAILEIEAVLASQRANVENKWRHGDQVSTEDLRVCLQQYRQFFDLLLSLIDGSSQ
jgi:hypothetical protein